MFFNKLFFHYSDQTWTLDQTLDHVYESQMIKVKSPCGEWTITTWLSQSCVQTVFFIDPCWALTDCNALKQQHFKATLRNILVFSLQREMTHSVTLIHRDIRCHNNSNNQSNNIFVFRCSALITVFCFNSFGKCLFYGSFSAFSLETAQISPDQQFYKVL